MYIAKQLLNINDISEDTLLRADMRNTCEETGIALLANCRYFYGILKTVLVIQSIKVTGYVRSYEIM